MNSAQLNTLDRMHCALEKTQGLMGILRNHHSRDYILNSEIRAVAWMVHDLCVAALKEPDEPEQPPTSKAAATEWESLDRLVVLKQAADILKATDPQTSDLVLRAAAELRTSDEAQE